MIVIESKRRKRENILKKYPDAVIADVTSQATDGLVKLSPFYPHGGIPVPFSEGYTAMCVEGIWQGLKVFESADVDVNMFANGTMKNIKRTVRQNFRTDYNINPPKSEKTSKSVLILNKFHYLCRALPCKVDKHKHHG